MFKKILAYISAFAVIIASSCSDDFNMPEFNGIGPDGEVVLTLDVPTLTTVKTRAADPEFQVNDVVVLIYNDENGAPAQSEHIYIDPNKNENNKTLTELTDNKLQLSFKIDKGIRNDNLTYYFIANPGNEYVNEIEKLTIEELKIRQVNSVVVSDCLTMCGTTTGNNGIINDSPVPLYRNAAKITVTDGEGENADVLPYQAFGMAEESVMLAGIENSLSPALNVGSFPKEIDNTDATYCHPTENVNSNTAVLGNIFVITKAVFDGDEYYYRMDFCKKNDGKTIFLNAKSNHWYQFIVKEVNGAGYATPEEASLHPDSDIVYEIHDHSPVSFNMISDGIRELGVSHKIDYEDTEKQAYLYIKVFSKIEGDMDDIKDKLSYTSEASWLSFKEIEEVSGDEYVGTDGFGDDKNNPGKIYRVPLNFTVNSGNISTEIVVKWMGLERKVPVEVNLAFDGATISTASLTINYNGETKIDDYWAFLSSTDNETPTGSPCLWGVQKDENNGKIRNQGFHFPVMYGEGGNLATYSYTLTFDKNEKFNNVTGVDIKCSDTNVSVTNNGDNKTFTITRNNEDRYKYITGKINFVFTFNDGTSGTYSFDTYHTGFFHQSNNEYRLDHGQNNDYFYYEVVPINIDGKNRYMLDRNLAAKSAQDYIRGTNGELVTGTDKAAGGYYYIAHQVNLYEDPKMFDVAPPGYNVPNKNEWGSIRTSSSFHTEYDGSLYPAYYETSIGRIYFPKAMMYLNGGHTGEGRAGYYWTSTASSGSEKEEIGRWLNMLVMAGSTTTYYNGYVLVNENRDAAYGCSVRCINKSDETEGQVKRTNFMVAGATHVYLYKVDDDGNRTSPMTWPGQSVFNFATAKIEAWTGFEYSSSHFYPEDMYVIFNFVDQNGVIHTFSKGSNGDTLYTTNEAPTSCNGWKVIGDEAKGIIPSGDITADGTHLFPAQKTALGNWWQCDRNAEQIKDYKRGDIYLYLIGDVFPNHSDWTPNDGIRIDASANNIDEFIWEGILEKKSENNTENTFKAYWNNSASNAEQFWAQPFFRPAERNNGDLYQIPTDKTATIPMMESSITKFVNGPDYKWQITKSGRYRLTFNVQNMTFTSQYLGDQ